MWDMGQVGYGTGETQDRHDVGHRTGGTRDRRDTGQVGHRTGGTQDRHDMGHRPGATRDRRDTGQTRCGTQDGRDTGQEGCGTQDRRDTGQTRCGEQAGRDTGQAGHRTDKMWDTEQAGCRTQAGRDTGQPRHGAAREAVAARSLWRNRLARSAVNRKVGGSSPPRDGRCFFSCATEAPQPQDGPFPQCPVAARDGPARRGSLWDRFRISLASFWYRFAAGRGGAGGCLRNPSPGTRGAAPGPLAAAPRAEMAALGREERGRGRERGWAVRNGNGNGNGSGDGPMGREGREREREWERGWAGNGSGAGDGRRTGAGMGTGAGPGAGMRAGMGMGRERGREREREGGWDGDSARLGHRHKPSSLRRGTGRGSPEGTPGRSRPQTAARGRAELSRALSQVSGSPRTACWAGGEHRAGAVGPGVMGWGDPRAAAEQTPGLWGSAGGSFPAGVWLWWVAGALSPCHSVTLSLCHPVRALSVPRPGSASALHAQLLHQTPAADGADRAAAEQPPGLWGSAGGSFPAGVLLWWVAGALSPCHSVTLCGPFLSPGPALRVPFTLSCSIRRRRPMALTGDSSCPGDRVVPIPGFGGPRGTSCEVSPPFPAKIRGVVAALGAPGRGSPGLSVPGVWLRGSARAPNPQIPLGENPLLQAEGWHCHSSGGHSPLEG
ncbi:hypothetical protein DV515_00018968, partial [Chloebia gouldiae]